MVTAGNCPGDGRMLQSVLSEFRSPQAAMYQYADSQRVPRRTVQHDKQRYAFPNERFAAMTLLLIDWIAVTSGNRTVALAVNFGLHRRRKETGERLGVHQFPQLCFDKFRWIVTRSMRPRR